MLENSLDASLLHVTEQFEQSPLAQFADRSWPVNEAERDMLQLVRLNNLCMVVQSETDTIHAGFQWRPSLLVNGAVGCLVPCRLSGRRRQEEKQHGSLFVFV